MQSSNQIDLIRITYRNNWINDKSNDDRDNKNWDKNAIKTYTQDILVKHKIKTK